MVSAQRLNTLTQGNVLGEKGEKTKKFAATFSVRGNTATGTSLLDLGEYIHPLPVMRLARIRKKPKFHSNIPALGLEADNF